MVVMVAYIFLAVDDVVVGTWEACFYMQPC
jgi:hypothetical protein